MIIYIILIIFILFVNKIKLIEKFVNNNNLSINNNIDYELYNKKKIYK